LTPMAKPPPPSAPASATRNTAWPFEPFMLNLMVQVVARPRPQAGHMSSVPVGLFTQPNGWFKGSANAVAGRWGRFLHRNGARRFHRACGRVYLPAI
jgi:hypothetical protein